MNSQSIKELIEYIIKEKSISNDKLIHLLRLNNDFYINLHNIFPIFALYEYLTSIFQIPLNVCDKNTYLRKRLRCQNMNYINHKQTMQSHLINDEYSIFLFVYNMYPMIHINLFKYIDVVNEITSEKEIIKLFYYKESEETIKIIFYNKLTNNFFIKEVKYLSEIDKLSDSLNNITDDVVKYNEITNHLVCFKYIFIKLKNVSNV